MATLNSDAQTTPSEVKEVFDTDLPDATINAFINAAVERRKDIPTSADLGTNREGMIEMYLAAHYLTAQDPRPDSEEHESLAISYEGEHTSYLAIAAKLDPTGTIGGSGDSASFGVPRVK